LYICHFTRELPLGSYIAVVGVININCIGREWEEYIYTYLGRHLIYLLDRFSTYSLRAQRKMARNISEMNWHEAIPGFLIWRTAWFGCTWSKFYFGSYYITYTYI